MKFCGLFIFLSLFTSSCAVTFETPPVGQSGLTIDRHLIGSWHPTEKPEGTLEFSVDKNNHMNVKFIDEKNTADRKSFFEVASFQLGKNSYLSVKLIADDEPDPIYMIAKYEFADDNALSIWMLDENKVGKLIDAGKIKGKRVSFGGVEMSASPAEVQKLLESTGSDDLFEPFATLKK